MNRKHYRIAIIIALSILAIIMGIYGGFGGFGKIVVSEEITGGEWFVFKKVGGDSQDIAGIADSINIYLSDSLHISTSLSASVYYEEIDTLAVSPVYWSDVGAILSFTPDSMLIEKISKHFEITELPQGRYVTTSFIFKNSQSYLVRTVKISRTFHKYIIRNKYNNLHPVTELFDAENNQITFRKRID